MMSGRFFSLSPSLLAREKSTQNNLTSHYGETDIINARLLYIHVCMYSKVYMPQYDYLKPTLVTDVLELPYLMNSDLEISKTNGAPESHKNNEPCRTWSKVLLF